METNSQIGGSETAGYTNIKEAEIEYFATFGFGGHIFFLHDIKRPSL